MKPLIGGGTAERGIGEQHVEHANYKPGQHAGDRALLVRSFPKNAQN